MTRAFVEMYAYAVLILLLLGILSSMLAEWWMTLYRRWEIRRELRVLGVDPLDRIKLDAIMRMERR